MALDKLSIIIVNYNTREDLRLCLAALRECHPMPEVIVVDNASKDGSADMVRNEFPQVVLLTPERNTWFCGGNNLGIQAAHREYALLLNPDTIPSKSALEAMVRFIEEHPDYAGATSQLRYPNGIIQRTCSRIPTYRYLILTQTPLRWLCSGMRRRAAANHWYEGWERDTDFDVEVVPGSCLMMRREQLLLEDRLLLYFPEDDLARRVEGRQFRLLASSHIVHREKSATRSALATQIYFCDLIVYTRKHHGLAGAGLMWLLTRPMLWGIALRWWLRRFEKGSTDALPE